MTGLLEEHLLQREFLLAQAREPNPEDPAYRDKQLNKEYNRINNPPRPTEGQLLGEEGGYLKDPETEEDTSKPVNYMERFVMPMKKEPGWNETGWPDDEAIKVIEGLLGDYNEGPEGNPLGREVYAPEGESNLVPDSGRWPRSAFNVPLQSSPSFPVDPKTHRQNVRDRKIENRAKSNDQGADIAKGKLRPEQKIDLPTFLQGVLKKVPEAAALSGALLWELFRPRGMFQLSELNPAQLEVLKKGIPLNLPNLPPDVRVDTMKRLTGELKKHGSIPTV